MDEADLLRAELYGLLARFLAKSPGQPLLDHAASLEGGAGPLGRALGELARYAATPQADVEREYNALFVGVQRGELVPYASYYLTGFLNDRPLARLRQDMGLLGLERSPGVAEPEDHVAALCEIMAGLIDGSLHTPPEVGERAFFERHLAPWAGRFFEDLERARAGRLYRAVGTIGRLFMAFEDEDERLPAVGGQVRPDVVRLGDGGGLNHGQR